MYLVTTPYNGLPFAPQRCHVGLPKTCLCYSHPNNTDGIIVLPYDSFFGASRSMEHDLSFYENNKYWYDVTVVPGTECKCYFTHVNLGDMSCRKITSIQWAIETLPQIVRSIIDSRMGIELYTMRKQTPCVTE